MLEAFKDAKGASGDVAGPFVARPTSGGPGGGRRLYAGNPKRWIVPLAALGLAFVLGVLAGRATAPDAPGVMAEERKKVELPSFDEPIETAVAETPLGASAEPDPPAEGGGRLGAANALADPRNKYTIVAIAVTPANVDSAWANHDHLAAQGMPVFPPFAAPNGMLTVVVGAAPKESDLADVQSRLKRLSGPEGKGRPYEGAYSYPIRKLTNAAGDE
jgi:hypothetical protein